MDKLHENLPRYHIGRKDIAATKAALDHLLFMAATFFEDMEWCEITGRWDVPITGGIFPEKSHSIAVLGAALKASNK